MDDCLLKNRWIAKPIVLLVMALLTSVSCWADQMKFTAETVEGVELTFMVIDEQLKTCRVSENDLPSTALMVTIPAEANGYEVTSVGTNAFKDCSSVVEIVIPATVKSIGTGAFYNCKNLERVNWPSTITRIDNGVFRGCEKLEPFDFTTSSVTEIGAYTFMECDKFKSLTIPSTITSIGKGAFANCDGLETVTYEATIDIPEGLFSSCSSLNTVNLKTWVVIGKEAFSYCTGLQIIDLTNVRKIGDESFKHCTGLKSIVQQWNSSGKPIGKRAFWGCSALQIVNNICGDEIGDSAFVDCVSLESVIFYTSIGKIGKCAFRGCSTLQTFGANEYGAVLGEIGDSAFVECPTLKTVCLANCVTPPVLGEDVFGEVANTVVTLIPRYSSIYGYFNEDRDYERWYEEAGWKNLDHYREVEEAFYAYAKNQNNENRQIRCTVTSSWPGDCLAKIGGQYVLNPLEPIEEPMLDEFGNPMYDEYGNPIMELIPTPLIDENTSELWPETGDEIIFLPSEEGVYKIDGIAYHSFGNGYGSSSFGIVIPEGVTFIEDEAFYYCDNMRSVTIPESVRSIGRGAFQYCSNLESVVLPSHDVELGESMFRDCLKLTSCVLPEDIETIPASFLSGCSLTEIDIPESVTTIDGNAFGDTPLVSVELPPHLETIGWFAFSNTNLKHIDIPASVSDIGHHAFDDCRSLDHLDLSHLTALTSSIDDIGGGMMIFAPKSMGVPSSFNRYNVAYFDAETDSWRCLGMHTQVIGNFSSPYDFVADKVVFNGWNTGKDRKQTIYFPFVIPDVVNLGKLYAYEGYDAVTGVVSFNRVMQMEPHVPYIFIPFDNYFNEKDLLLYNIEVKNTKGLSSEEKIGFNGVYLQKTLQLTAADNIYGFNWNGDFARATGYAYMKPFVAYFKLPEGASVRVNSSFKDDVTSVGCLTESIDESASWYSVTGQQQRSSNLRKGLYIRNGKKVIVR